MNVNARAALLAACAVLAVGGYTGIGRAAPAVLVHPRGSDHIANVGKMVPAPGHFAGKFELVPLFSKGRPVLRNGHSYYAARNDVLFTTAAGDTVTFHAGQRTDLASIPEVVWSVMPPDGPWAEAAPPHDACYRTLGTFLWAGHVGRTRATPYTRAECDELLRQGMVALGVPSWKRIVIFEAVRGFGGRGWGT